MTERKYRELLKLAAKAAGIDHPGGEHSRYNDGRLWDCNGLRWWNPLEDDGDALRLAADLHISISYTCTAMVGDIYAQPPIMARIFEPVSADIHAATRRAIVRAAAAMCDRFGAMLRDEILSAPAPDEREIAAQEIAGALDWINYQIAETPKPQEGYSYRGGVIEGMRTAATRLSDALDRLRAGKEGQGHA